MADPTSAAPLWTIRKTTSRKPKNEATISDVEMTWLPVARARVRVEEKDSRRAIVYQQSSPGWR
jgi:hypothetical protein